MLGKPDAVYWDNIVIPSRFLTPPKQITGQQIKHFAAMFDPQPYHLDRDAAKASLFGGLCASGWHMCAIMMRLLSDSMDEDNIQFLGNDEIPRLKWLFPVFEDDKVQADIAFIEKCPPAESTDFGTVDADIQVKNQNDKLVMALTATLMIKTGPNHGI
ncbi:MAG: MaoC/PaaZ C-terminal domain-containing protein [Paracoccaceae bacterium]|nr:MaoC/PaaZ C-terminal domain-containing protein [Paracoccaceae bacterium]